MTLSSLDIAAVWRALGGGKLRGNRGCAFWRDGDGFSVALNRAKGAWFDHRDGRGGGVLDLVQLARGIDRAGALRWLEASCGLDSQRALSPDERIRYARAAAGADALAQRLADFAWALELLTERRLTERAAALMHFGLDSTEPLAELHRIAFHLRKATAAELAQAWRQMRRDNPGAVDRLERVGREDRQHAEAVTWGIVDMLTRSAEEVAA